MKEITPPNMDKLSANQRNYLIYLASEGVIKKALARVHITDVALAGWRKKTPGFREAEKLIRDGIDRSTSAALADSIFNSQAILAADFLVKLLKTDIATADPRTIGHALNAAKAILTRIGVGEAPKEALGEGEEMRITEIWMRRKQGAAPEALPEPTAEIEGEATHVPVEMDKGDGGSEGGA